MNRFSGNKPETPGAGSRRSINPAEPPAFHDRVTGVLGGASLLPGALTVRTARRLDVTVDTETAAARGAGVQLCYEGLELTRSVLRDEPWTKPGEDYHQDLLVAEVLVSQGFSQLAHTGVVTDAVAIVQRFGRTQTNLEQLGDRHTWTDSSPKQPSSGRTARPATNPAVWNRNLEVSLRATVGRAWVA